MRTRTILSVAATGACIAVAAVPALAHRTAARAATVQTHTVKFGEYFYKPKKLTINVGDSVKFTNVGKIEHTVADSTKSGTIRSKIIKPRPLAHGRSQTVTFKKPGTVYYLCTFHPTLMKGVLTVR